MDRSWMLEARTSDAYLSGIEQFLSFAVKNANKQRRKPVLIRCPCFECDNVPPGLSISEVRNHLVCTGFDPGYSKWFWHGEDCGFTSNVEDEDVVQCDEDVGEAEFLEDEDVEMVEGASDDLRSDPITFHEQLKDAEKPLYEGCSKFSKLSALAELYNFKAGNGLSDKGFSELLEILKDMLPEENELPKSTYQVKKTLNSLGLGYEKIHACSNDCILYRKEYRDLNACPTCKRSRWMPNKHPRKGSKGVPVKVMWYFSPIPRFKRMFGDERVAKEFLWHHEERKKDGVLRHPADTPAWQLVNDKWPEFAEEPRNLRLALSADGVNPHSSLRSKHSCWPVMMAIYNLPPGLCMKKEYMMLTMLISGHPGKEIDVYLAPLIDDLKLLWDVGVEVYDSNKGQNFILKAVLMWTINDFPSYGDLSGCSTQGYKACPICSEKTYSKWLKYSRKVCYTGHRRFLPSKHPFRRQMKAFDGKQEFDSAPGPLSGEETFNKVCNLQVTFGKKKKQKRAVSMTLSKLKKSKKSKKSNKSRKNEDEDCVDISRKRKRSVGEQLQVTRDNHHVDAFKKKSIFFELEYWKYLLVRHMLDVMHIEKNVCESILATVLDVAGKSKDDLNSRLDLKHMGIKEELQPKDLENGTFLPPACFKLTKEEKQIFCTVQIFSKEYKFFAQYKFFPKSVGDLGLCLLCREEMHQLVIVQMQGQALKVMRGFHA